MVTIQAATLEGSMHESDARRAADALKQAVDKAGSTYKLGEIVGKGQSTVSAWLKRGAAAPESVLFIEKATGISRHDLRPDVFGPRHGVLPRRDSTKRRPPRL